MTNSLGKSTFIYTIGNLVYTFSQWVMMVVTVKICGFQSAGLLSLAMSVTAAPAIVTLFNIRNYQVSDTDSHFCSKSYISSRHFTCMLSFLVCCIIVFANGYRSEKVSIPLIYMALKLVEGYVDVYAGIEHKYNRLDLAGISALLRGLATMLLYTVALIVTKDMALGIALVVVACAVVMLLFDCRRASRLIKGEVTHPHTARQEVFGILRVCFPLAVVAFLNNLSISVPKLILEQSWDETLLGIYNSLSSPTIVIQIVLGSIFAPWIPILSEQFLRGEARFIATSKNIMIKGLLLSVFGMTAVVVMVKVGIIGLAMRLVYNSEIEQHAVWFIPICLVSGLTVINSCLFSVCTLIRKVKSQYIIGVCGLASSYVFSRIFIPTDGIRGLIIATGISLLIQILIQIAFIVDGYRQRFHGVRA